jgi:hypothetical protein
MKSVATLEKEQTLDREQTKGEERTMDFEAVLRRVRAEFAEMPGLRLTPAQATRLWGLERDACYAVIQALIDASFLRWTPAGAITRAES